MADLANPALATTLTAIRSVSVAGQRGRASACGDGGGAAGGYRVGEEVRKLFAGELTFPEQCMQAGLSYVELGSGDDDDDVDMLAFVDDQAEEEGASKATHNTYCEICGAGGCIVPCDYCNCSFHGSCLQPELVLPPDGDDFACPSCVSEKRAGGGDSVSVPVVSAPHDAAADAAARRDRDEEVRREHRAICAFVREHTSAAETRSLTWAGEAAAATRSTRGAAEAAAVKAAAGGARRIASKKQRSAGRKKGRGADVGDTDGSVNRKGVKARCARQRNATRMAASRAAAAASAPMYTRQVYIHVKAYKISSHLQLLSSPLPQGLL